MKRYQSKTRLEIKGTGLGGEDLSENKQFLEDITERLEESECRTKADTQKRQPISKTKKRKLKKGEKSNGKIWRDKKREVQDESDTGDKNIKEGVVQKWLVFIRFIRGKFGQGREFKSEDLQEENNERKARKIQHKQMQAQQSQATQVLQQQQSQILAFLLQDSEVVYFK